MKIHYANHESKRHRGGSWIWYRNRDGIVCRTRPFDGIQCWPDKGQDPLFWCYARKRWTSIWDKLPAGGTNTFNCRGLTHRKFRRLLRQWSKYLPRGYKFIAAGRLVGPEMLGRTS